jgi:hypothetical protein
MLAEYREVSMVRGALLIAFSAMLLPIFAQTPAENAGTEQKEPGETADETARPSAGGDAKAQPAATADAATAPKWEPNSPEGLLWQAYLAGGQLSSMAHALQMEYLVINAEEFDHPMLRQWVNELLQLTQTLPQNDDTVRISQVALVAISKTDPAEALHMLTRLAPVAVAAPAVPNGVFNDSTAARQIFPRYWKGVKNPEVAALQAAADYLGNTGWQYPFAAVALVLPEIAAKDSIGAQSFFLDATQFFQSGSAGADGSRPAYVALLKASKNVVPDAMLRSAITGAVDQFLKDASQPAPKGTMYIGSVGTSKGTVELNSLAEESLYRLMPLVREFIPELEKTIFEKRPAIGRPVSAEGVSLPDGLVESATIRVGTADPQRIATAVQRNKEAARERSVRALSSTDPETAVKLAATIKDPAVRGSAMAAIANGKLKETDPDRAAELMPTMGTSAEKIDPKDQRRQLGALVTEARTQAGREDAAIWETINRGLDLAEELFVHDMKEFPKTDSLALGGVTEMPAYAATGFDEAMTLIRMGVGTAADNTLHWLAKEHDPALKPYLLMSAADAYWHLQQAQPSASAPTVRE